MLSILRTSTALQGELQPMKIRSQQQPVGAETVGILQLDGSLAVRRFACCDGTLTVAVLMVRMAILNEN